MKITTKVLQTLPHTKGAQGIVAAVSISMIIPLVAQLIKNPPAMWETWIQSLGWKDPLEKGKAYPLQHSAWRIPWTV